MQPPIKPPDEEQRLRKLRELGLLDSFPDERFDRITRITRRLFETPMALISLVDEERQWYMSCLGLERRQAPRAISFCGHAILGEGPMVVTDTLQDPRFSDNPWVLGEPRIRFYAGCPLRLHGGSALGALAVMDTRARSVSRDDLALMRELADMVEHDLASMAQASTDASTGLVNRAGFLMLGHQALRMCARAQAPAVLAFVDFEASQLSAEAADRALQAFARLLHQGFRGSDVVARLGERSFVVLATHATEADMRLMAERLDQACVAAGSVPPQALGSRLVSHGFLPDGETQIAQLLQDWAPQG
jgi:diguanylate cyclase (GGDEF)-like protein